MKDPRIEAAEKLLASKGMSSEDIPAYIEKNKDKILLKPLTAEQQALVDSNNKKEEVVAEVESIDKESIEDSEMPEITSEDLENAGISESEEVEDTVDSETTKEVEENADEELSSDKDLFMKSLDKIRNRMEKGYKDIFLKPEELTQPMIDALESNEYQVSEYSKNDGEIGHLITDKSQPNPMESKELFLSLM